MRSIAGLLVGVIGLFGVGLFLATGMVGCSGDDGDVEFDCQTHDECLDDEACLAEVCTEAPIEGQECPAEHEGERYEHLICEYGEWVDFERPDAPRIQSLTATPPSADPGETIELNVEVSSEADELDYDWEAPEGWELEQTDAATVDLVTHVEWGQTATIGVEVTDPYDQSDSAEITTSTHEPDGPEITSIDAEPEPVVPGQLQTIEVAADHPHDFELSYSWTIPEGWTAQTTLEGRTIEIQAPSEHEIDGNVEVTVRDEQDNEATVSTGVSTVSNPGPTIEELNAEETVLEPGGSTEVTVETSHELDHDIEAYHWEVDDEDWAVPDSEPTGTVTAGDQPGDSVTLTVEVEDAFGAGDTETLDLETAPNDDPVVTAELTAEDNPVAIDGDTFLSVEAHDPQGTDLSYNWDDGDDVDWTLDADYGDDDQAHLEAPRQSEATVTITVAIIDQYGGQTTEELTVSTVANEGPEITDMYAETNPMERDDSTVVHVQAHHPQEGVEVDEYTWSRDDTDWALSGSGDDAILESPDHPDSVSVEVTVEVGDELEETTDQTLDVAIDHESPTIEDLSITDPELFAEGDEEEPLVERDDEFEVSVEAEADNERELSYEWSVEGEEGDWSIEDEDASTTTGYSADLSEVSATVEVVVADDWGFESTETVEFRTMDYEPAAFAFPDKEGAEPHDWAESAPVVVQDFEAELTATCHDGCEVRRNEGAYGSDATGVESGDTIQIRLESGNFEETEMGYVELGETSSDIWTIEVKQWQGQRQFTTCGQGVGRFGPEQLDCDIEYDDGLLDDEVEVNAGTQSWTVPSDGTYSIEALGAGRDGDGARAYGEIYFDAGTELEIIVGQPGEKGDEAEAGSGGTFVVTDGDDPLVVAGGSGGAYDGGSPGRADTSGGDGDGSGTWTEYSGGTEGHGGESTEWDNGGGGGGVFSDGEDEDYDPAIVGRGFVNGGQGGESVEFDGYEGGFGGGAAARSGDFFGGGGGYSGGAGGEDEEGTAGGGGSFVTNDANNDDKEAGVNSGTGQVNVDWVSAE